MTALGILGIRSAVQQGGVIAGGELTTARADGPAGPEHGHGVRHRRGRLEAADPAEAVPAARVAGRSLLPAIDAQVFSLEQLHTGDGTASAEYADLKLFIRQWTAVRDLLSRADLTAQPPRRSLSG